MLRNEYSPSYTGPETFVGPERIKRWFALSVIARHEKAVSRSLQDKGFETFLPLYTKRHQYQRRSREFDLPLFSGYVFCRSDMATRLPILITPGVIQMVGAGRVPIPLDDHEIWSLQRAAEAGITMCPHPCWRSGQIGRIIAGPLIGIEGVVVSAKQTVRLVLSITLLQRAVLLEIDSDCVALVGNAESAELGLS